MKTTLILSAIILALAGCSSTTRITEYDVNGKITKEIRTEESIAKTITESTKNKSLFVWDGGWAGYLSISPGTTEDPSPHGKMFVGKTDKGYLAITDTVMIYADSIRIPDAIRAIREGSVGVTQEGIQGGTPTPPESP